MNVVGKVGSLISQGVYSVAAPFHPFGGAVDIIVVQQQDGTFRSTPWYVRFGKFQGVLKGAEKMVKITVNGVEANFHMYLGNSGEAYFDREVVSGESSSSVEIVKDGIVSENNSVSLESESDSGRCFYEFSDDNNLEDEDEDEGEDTKSSNSEVVLVSVDGHIMTAPILNSEMNGGDVELDTPQFHLGPCKDNDEDRWNVEYLAEDGKEVCELDQENDGHDAEPNGEIDEAKRVDEFKSCLELLKLDSSDESVFPFEFMDKKDISLLSSDEMGSVDQHVSHIDDEPFKSGTNGEFDEKKMDSLDEYVSHIEIEGEKGISQLSDETGSVDQPVSQTDYEPDKSGINGEIDDKKKDSSDMSVSPFEIEGEKNTSQLADEAGNIGQPEDEPNKNGTKESPLASSSEGIEISLCGNLLQTGMGLTSAEEVFNAHLISKEDFRLSSTTLIKNENLVIKFRNKYLTWEKAAPIVLGIVAYDLKLPFDPKDTIQVECEDSQNLIAVQTSSSHRWSLWSRPFRRVKTISSSLNEDVFVDAEKMSNEEGSVSSRKEQIRTNVPTTEQIAMLNLKEGQNVITFSFSTRVFGLQQVDAHIYLWKWNARIVISDVDGTITKSDVLGQFMPLVGKDWTQSGVAQLFSAIKENGYQLLFLSARAIVQAYLTRSFLLNLKQDGKALPTGPVVISPDGLLPSLYREVIRRTPHEFKIACLQDIKALFPPDYNPFYAGFGNRDTDELSYRKIGIPKGKIFIINPKGEVAISQHRIDVKTYKSLHTLVNDMFPPTMVEQEDFNSWNFWKLPLSDI